MSPLPTSARWEFEAQADLDLSQDPASAELLEKNMSLSAALQSVVKDAVVDLRGGLDPRERAIIGLLAKAFKTHRAVVILASLGYGEDAHSLARSLFETAVYAKAIAADTTGQLAERWVDFTAAESYLLLHMAREGRFPTLDGVHAAMAADPEAFADIDRRAEEIQRKWRFWRERKSDGAWFMENHWSGKKNLRELAESVDMGEQYAVTETLASQEIHASSAAVAGYIREEGNELIVSGAPSLEGVPEALADASAYLTIVADAWALIMDVPQDIKSALGLQCR